MDSIIVPDMAGGKILCDFFGLVLPLDESIYPGAERKLQLRSVHLGTVKVIAVRKFKAFQLRDIVCALETGEADVKLFSRKLTQSHGPFAPGDDLLHVVVKYTEKEIEALEQLGAAWWQNQKVS